MMIDPNLPPLIGALGTLAIGLGTMVIQIIILVRQSKTQAELADNKGRMAILHDMVDGQSEKLNKAIGEKSYAQGHADGIQTERAEPMSPTP